MMDAIEVKFRDVWEGDAIVWNGARGGFAIVVRVTTGTLHIAWVGDDERSHRSELTWPQDSDISLIRRFVRT